MCRIAALADGYWGGAVGPRTLSRVGWTDPAGRICPPLTGSAIGRPVDLGSPVLIAVGATVFALVPLALHGGPLWEPLCYAQIRGLAVATVITLLLVPVFYSIAVLDLKIIKWEPGKH